MLKSLKRSLAGVSLLAALCSPTNASADYQLKYPELTLVSPRSTRFTGSEFSSYGVFDYGAENGFSMNYDGRDLTISYGNLSYNTGNGQEDFIDGMLDFAGSSGNIMQTPLDGIMNSALSIDQIREHNFGRFTLNDIFLLFRSFYNLFDENNLGSHVDGDADITLGGKLDLQQYSNMHFLRNNINCFFEHGTRLLAEGNANAGMSYSLDGNGVSLGTRYDELLDRTLELSLNADFRTNILKSDSYRIGIENGNNRYGVGFITSDFTRMQGTENAHILVNSSLTEIFNNNKVAYLDSHENNSLSIEDGTSALLYLFHTGVNGPFWHSGYLGIDMPNYQTSYRASAFTENMELRHNLNLNDPKTIAQLINGNIDLYDSFYMDSDLDYRNTYLNDNYESPRLDYGLTIGLNEGPIRPVLSVSRLRDSRFFFNFVLPYAVFNVSSDLTMPHHAFLTFDKDNSEVLGNFLRNIEENSVMPNAAPNAMNDYARLAAYSNVSGPMITFSSENEALSASLFYSRLQKYFLELGVSNSSIDSKGVFFRGGVRNFMATVGYSYLNRPNEDYSSQGILARISGRSNSLYYTLSARGMIVNFSQDHTPPNDLNEKFRTELILGGNF